MDETDTERLGRQINDLAVALYRLEQAQAKNQQTAAVLGEEQIAVRGVISTLRANPDAPPPSAGPAVEWMTVEDPEAATAALTQLRSWVLTVWTKYDPIHDCWPWHPPVVAELLACRRAWVAATSKAAPALAPADWHQRFRTGTHKAITARLKECDATQGHHLHPDFYDVDHHQLHDLAAWWASTHGSPNGAQPLAPGLTRKTTT